MDTSEREKLTDIWDAFERAGFQYASHRGGVHQLEEMRDQRQDHLPIRKNILQEFLNGESDLETFQSDMVTQAANTKLWGFSGGGGRFFNQLIASADLHEEIDLEHLLQKILAEPGDPETAADYINELVDFVEHVRPQVENIYEAPQAGFVPYFLSYFWQLHDPNTFPIYYKSMRDALADLDIWEPSGDLAEDYLEFWELNEDIRRILIDHTDQDIHLWDIERLCLYWNSRDELTSFSDTHIEILQQWREAASSIGQAMHFKFEEAYFPKDAEARARAFIDDPTEEGFELLWDPLHSAQRAGNAGAIYSKWTDESGRSDEELASLIQDILDADTYDQSWESRLGATKTLWELFGLLHIDEYPIVNSSTERGLAFFGYDRHSRYEDAVEEFEAFKNEYQILVGHVTEGTAHAVPINYEIDQLLNVIDKVSVGHPEQEEFEEAATLYRTILDEKDRGGPLEEDLIDPDSRRPPKAWQVAPDHDIDLWNAWANHGVMSIGWKSGGNYSGLSREEIAERLEADTTSNNVTTIYYFANSIIPGDVVIARHGREQLDGIGVVKSTYYFDPTKAENLYPESHDHHQNHVDVEWIIDFVDEFEGPVDLPSSMSRQFAMETVRNYKYFEELKTELTKAYPELTEKFSKVEERQSEISSEYWVRAVTAGEYADIEEATRDILNRLDSQEGTSNWIADHILTSVTREWAEVLRRNDLVAGEVDPADRPVYEQILSLYRDNKTRLEKQARDIGAGYLEDLTPDQTLFVVLLRELQMNAKVSPLNFNQVKMQNLLDGKHLSVPEEGQLPTADPPDNVSEIERQLTNTGQLVFYGPPGTGKTYTAQQFARWWLNQGGGDPPTVDQLETVTFHPSFSYEDFLEGLTAEAHDGTVEYRIKDGVFKRICQRATEAFELAKQNGEEENAKRFVLIIDEINRGNLAQIFGETITLLERDKRLDQSNHIEISLAHSLESFSVPPNLYVIGTMNTADRSIALVDAALRRRFRFIGFPPDYATLIRYHEFEGLEDVTQIAEGNSDRDRNLLALSILAVREINDRIVNTPDLGKGKQIGHSYLMGVHTAEDIRDAWKFEILPLLEEYYFGQFERIREELFLAEGGRLFDWDTEQIADFTVDDLRRTIANLVDITLTEPEADVEDELEDETVYTQRFLLEEGVLQPEDELIFDESLLPEERERPFDPEAAFWRCEVTGKRGQSDGVRWLHNDEEYSLSGLAQTILEQASDWTGPVSGPNFWVHPEFDQMKLVDLREGVESRQITAEMRDATE